MSIDLDAPFDFKELFIYKVLEKLNIGPKVHFAINKYLKKGVFILSEDLSEGNRVFTTMNQMD